jgi:two-component system, NarL family, sensor kinase
MKAQRPLSGGRRRIHDLASAKPDPVIKLAAKRGRPHFGPRLLSLQENVIQRIASDLHDSTCQHLIAASLNVMRLKRAISQISIADEICDEIDASIDEALNQIRALTYVLHPQNLLADGLKTTVERFVAGFSRRTSLKTNLEIAPEIDELPYKTQHSLLRVIQEALSNVFRHARATEVKITIEAGNGNFRVQVSDDGCGMPFSEAGSNSVAISFGVGIPAMRARLQQIGGALEIHSASAPECGGTTVCAVVPHFLPRARVRLSGQRDRDPSHRKSIAKRH